MDHPSYEDVCRISGQLLIESRFTIDNLNKQINDLRLKLTITEKERDTLISRKSEGGEGGH